MTAKRQLSTLLDFAVFCSAASCLLVAAGGGFRFELLSVPFSLTGFMRPAAILAVAIVLKTMFPLHDGLVARLARGRSPFLSAAWRFLHRTEVVLHSIRWKLALAGVTFVLCLALVEFGLRIFISELPFALGNYIANGYHADPSGIYRFRPEMKMLMMRPSYKRRMYFNGYHWIHQTDSMGFRNPQDRRKADIVLLGDSMIYGHGLEETSTVRHHLERMLRRPVANLGIQGAGIHQEYQVLKRYGMALKPSYVFLFFLVNDINDIVFSLSEQEMQRFLDLPVEDHESTYFDVVAAPHDGGFPLRAYRRELYVFKALEFFRQYVRPVPARRESKAERERQARPPRDRGTLLHEVRAPVQRKTPTPTRWEELPPFVKDPGKVPAMRFHLRALLKIQDLTRRGGADFVNVFIPTRGFRDQEPYYEKILRNFCAENGIKYYNLEDGFRRSGLNRASVTLKDDGHLSDLGARVVARLLFSYVTTGHFDIHPAG
jgi:hypothetical protein